MEPFPRPEAPRTTPLHSRVLIIDDEEPMRRSIAMTLEVGGYTPVCATSMEEAERRIEEAAPDLILCDVYMAGEDGLSGLARIRAHPPTAATPVILMTGRFDAPVMRRGMDLGADDFLVKPFGPKELLKSVQSRLDRIERLRDDGAITRRRLLGLLNTAAVFIGTIDPTSGKFEYINAAGRAMAELPAGALPSLRLEDLFASTGEPGLPSPAGLDGDGRKSWSGEAILRTTHGREVHVSIVVTRHRGTGSGPYCSVMAHDIGPQRRAMEALRQSEAMLRGVMENAHEPIAVFDRGERRIWANAAFERALVDQAGASDPFGGAIAAKDRPVLAAALARAWRTGRSGTFGFRVQRGVEDEERFFEAHASLVAADRPESALLILIARDYTSRKAAERERDFAKSMLDQAQKLESVGRLAAGIAHEINTPIQFVGDNTRFLGDAMPNLWRFLSAGRELARRAEAVPELREEALALRRLAEQADLDFLGAEIPSCIEQTLEGIQRVARIVRAMKEFSHPGPDEISAVDLNRAIESTTIVARNEWKYVAELVLDLDPDLGPVPCVGGQINQVVLNLLVNAAHAIGEKLGEHATTKGTITIATRRVDAWAEIRVRDTGTGIPPAVQKRLFEPFFTTKPIGQGTGQGLALTRSVVERHGGALSYETEPGVGTCFIVRLPLEGSASEKIAS